MPVFVPFPLVSSLSAVCHGRHISGAFHLVSDFFHQFLIFLIQIIVCFDLRCSLLDPIKQLLYL